MDDTIHQLSTKFLKTLTASLGKSINKNNSNNGNEVLSDPTLHIIIHLISCTRSLRDIFETSAGDNSKTKNNIHNQLYQPILNGILALLGKLLMDSFTYEPKVSDTAMFTTAFRILGRHILTLFPEMATKKHKTSGKMLIHHAVFKARPAIAEEIVGLILKVAPSSGRAEDATGALPLHWATRNPEVSFELVDLLLRAHPEAPSKADGKGFLPLHWSVNQDAPNLEVIRKLIKIHPAGAGSPSHSGNLPLHYCVSRSRPNISVIKALVTAYPDGIRCGCEDGLLPLHRYLHRPIVDLDALQLLLTYYPDAQLARSNRGQTPLHVALDHPSPDALAVELLVQSNPAALKVADTELYLPLHVCLDCAEPNYTLALLLLQAYPAAAMHNTKDGMLPLHLLVGSNIDPTHEHHEQYNNNNSIVENKAITFVTALLQAHPQALATTVRDIIPAIDGIALADPDSWSGEWVEAYWSPVSRARDRGLTGLVDLFRSFQQRHGLVDPTDIQPLSDAQPLQQQQQQVQRSPPTLQQLPQRDVRFNENNSSQENINFQSARPVKSEPLYNNTTTTTNNNNSNNGNNITPTITTYGTPVLVTSNYTAVNPLRTSSHPSGRIRQIDSISEPDSIGEVYVSSSNGNSSSNNQITRPVHSAPTVKVPAHILKAQQMARSSNNGSSVGGSQNGDTSRATSAERGGDRNQQQQKLQQQYLRQQQQQQSGGQASTTSSSGSVVRAPPAGPIPASLLQAAENNALRLSRPSSALPAYVGQNSSSNTSSSTSNTPALTALQQQMIEQKSKATRRSPSHRSLKSAPQGGRTDADRSTSFPFPDSAIEASAGKSNRGSVSAGPHRTNSSNSLVEDAAQHQQQQDEEQQQQQRSRTLNAWTNSDVSVENTTTAATTTPAPTTTTAVVLTAKQQRLLQAQQAYMRRTSTIATTTTEQQPNTALSAKPLPQLVAAAGQRQLHPGNMGGKMRILPVSAPGFNARPHNTNLDEIV